MSLRDERPQGQTAVELIAAALEVAGLRVIDVKDRALLVALPACNIMVGVQECK